MQNYVRELDQKGRATYRDKVKDLEGGQVAINKLYSEQLIANSTCDNIHLL